MQIIRSPIRKNLLIVENNFVTIENVSEHVYSDIEKTETVVTTGRRTRPAGLNISRRTPRPSQLNKNYKKKIVYKFKLLYSIGIDDVFQNKTYSVKIQLATKFVVPPPMISSNISTRKIRSMLSNIQNQMLITKAIEAEQAKYLLAETISDITAYLDNSIVNKLKTGTLIKDIPEAYKKKLVVLDKEEFLKTGDSFGQLSSNTTISEDAIGKKPLSNYDKRAIMFDMMSRLGIDPSEVSKLKASTVNSVQSSLGMVTIDEQKQNISSSPVVAKFVNSLLQDPDDKLPIGSQSFDDMKKSNSVTAFVSTLKDTLVIPVFFEIDKDDLFLEQQTVDTIHVKLQLLNEKGNVFDTQVKSFSISSLENVYNIPKKPPVVNVSSSGSDVDLLIQAKQTDRVAKGMKVYKKTINNLSIDINDYELVGDFSTLNSNDIVNITTTKPINSMVLYRFVSYGSTNKLSSQFTNVILRPKVLFPVKSISVYAEQESTGIKINVLQIPAEAVSIAVLVKNLSLHERTYKIVSNVKFIDDVVRASGIISFFDQNVKENNVYSYMARIYYKSGLYVDMGNDVLTYIRPEINKIDTKFTDIVVDQVNNNVTFNIESLIQNTDVDNILDLMRAGDFIEFYRDELKDERSLMKMLIAYNIQRVDVTTGVREDFGIFTGVQFNDVELGKKMNISQLKIGHQYAYYVYPLLRDAESTLEKFVKNSIDEKTKKSYNYLPNKFKHPINLKYGLLTTKIGRQALFGNSELQYGVIGDVKKLNVSFEDINPVIFDQTAKKLDADNVIIQWRISGQISQIDHFVIIREIDGIRSIVGYSHCEFDGNLAYYIHELTDDDIGDVSYIIIMIMNDYNIGPRIITNKIRIEA